jgi:hypothetical protein
MLRSQKAPWTKYHNVVGLLPKSGIWAHFSGVGDGIVSFSSAHLDEVESEMVVQADHVAVHTHPRSILEVRRILLEHLQEFDSNSTSAAAEPARFHVHQPASPAQQPSAYWNRGQVFNDNQVAPAIYSAPATPPNTAPHPPATGGSCQCDCCRKKELPRFDYSGLK